MNKKLKSAALKVLSGHWVSLTCISLVYFAVSYILINTLSSIFEQQITKNPQLGLIMNFLISIIFIPIVYGILKYSIDLKTGKQEIKTLFKFYLDIKLFFKTIGSYLLQYLYVLLKYMLFIIPGIIAYYEYALVEYLIIKEPEIKISGAIKKSKELMKNHKSELFLLQLSCLGWYVLILIIMVLVEIIIMGIFIFLGMDEKLIDTIIGYVISIIIGIGIAVLTVYIRFASLELFDRIYNKYLGVETIEEDIDETVEEDTSENIDETVEIENDDEINVPERIIQGNKILCQRCNTKNGLKRDYCWMCGKKI